MKIGGIIAICFFIISCSFNDYIDNKEMIASIDSLEISKTIFEVETDSVGNILDTTSISYFKYDSEGRNRYKEKNYKYKDTDVMLRYYFRPDEDLFYRESLFVNEDEIRTTYEVIANENGRIARALQISNEFDSIDTLTMEYQYRFHLNGKVKNLTINTYHEEIGAANSKIIYDNNEAALYEVMVMDDDTLSYRNWEYLDSKLNRSVFISYQIDTTKLVCHFGDDKQLIKEERFKLRAGDYFKLKEIVYFYNASNEKLKSIEENQETKEKKYVKYLIME